MPYIKRQIRAFEELERRFPDGGKGVVSHCCIQHADNCPILKREPSCACIPDMLMLPGVGHPAQGKRFEVTRSGRLRVAPQSLRCAHGFEPLT